MTWHRLSVIVRPEEIELLSERLFALGCAGIEETDVEQKKQLQEWEPSQPAPPAPVLLRASFEDPDRARIEAALDGRAATWETLADVDWSTAWRAGFAPIIASPRLVVAPPWDAPAGAIVIEPGQGFGTGRHPTTQGVLAALDALERQGRARTVLDVGTGSGVLAIAATRLGLDARGIDLDPAAVENARANAARNGAAPAFAVAVPADVHEPADLVLANLHAEVLVQVAPDLIRLTRVGLVVSGILADREALVRAALAPPFVVESRAEDEGWVTLVLLRGSRG